MSQEQQPTPEPRNELYGVARHEDGPGWHRFTDGHGGGYTEHYPTPSVHLCPTGLGLDELRCPECGPIDKTDEDGCCPTCGADTNYESLVSLPPGMEVADKVAELQAALETSEATMARLVEAGQTAFLKHVGWDTMKTLCNCGECISWRDAIAAAKRSQP